MFKIKFILLQFLLLLFLRLASASYPIILLPKIIHLDTDEKISVTSTDLKNDENYDFEIHDSSVHSELFYKSTFKLISNETKILKFSLNKYPTFGKIVVSFTDHSTKKTRNNIVPVSKLNGITIVQTDKPIYTPKQEIKIRMLRLDKNFRPINDNLRLKIVNPQNIIMENILFAKENQTSYFVDHYFYIPPAPIMGIWKAVVYQTSEHSFNTSFDVQEYVLPTFTIELNATELILKSTKKLEGIVSVDYVYGKPVEGFVAFKFGHGDLNSQIEFIGKSKLKDLYLGKSNFSFDITEFYIISPTTLFDSNKRFVIEVEVNEFVTGKKVKKLFSKGLFTTSAFKFSFDDSINSFKPEIENRFMSQLLYANGKIAPEVPINIEIPEINLVRRLITNKDGYFNFSFIVDNNKDLDQIKVNLKTSDPSFDYGEQVEDSKILLKHQSPTGGYLSIIRSSSFKEYKVGDLFEADFILNNLNDTQFSSFHYYLITSSGNPIESKRIKYLEKIKFRIRNEHYPLVSLILIGYPLGYPIKSNLKNTKFEYKTNDVLITDTIQIEVKQQENCGIKTRLFSEFKLKDSDLNKVSIFKPGEQVNLEFSSSNDQQLSLIGVDKAVYSLSANTLLVKDKLNKLYKENTLICGKGGFTYNDVLMNSGIILFDPDSQTNHNPISSLCKGYQSDSEKKSKKELKGSNRIRRYANEAFNIKYNYSKDKETRICCLLGSKMTKLKTDPKLCHEKLKIFKKRVNSTKCIEAFENCCFSSQAKYDNQRVSAIVVFPLSEDTIVDTSKPEFVHIAEDDALEKQTYIREDFRETWLFDVYPLEKNKPTNLTFKLPDSITTQSLSTFALSNETGICFFQNKPIEFRTFQKVFMQILLPYQAVQNEQLEMIITVFNYDAEDQPIIVYFFGVDGICSEADTDVKSERKSLAVPKQSSKSITIPLVPLKTGKFKIKIVAVSTHYTDVVIKELDVISQGVTVEDEYSFQLDPKNKQKRAKRHITTDRFQDKIVPEENSQFTKLKLSPNQKSKLIVPNSESCIISAIADEFGPSLAYSFSDSDISTNEISKSKGSITDLGHLINKPRGCGEQTAFYYAPTLYTLIYLESMNKLTAEQKEKGIRYLKSGYKRQLMFRKSDGSFSAFPNRKSSIWLTSFIMKLFCASSKYIELDNEVIKNGLLYLFSKQDLNGYWSEINPVMHKQLIGGTTGRVPLTASVLTTLRTCSHLEQINLDINQELVNSIQRSENFLHFYKDDIIKSKNAFKIAILAHSLIESLSYRDISLELLTHLETLSTIDQDHNTVFWKDDYPVEAASLVLLSLANIENQKLSLSPKLFKNSATFKNGTTVVNTSAKSFNNQLGRLSDDKKFIDNSDKLLKKLNPQSIVNYLISQKTFTGGFDTTQNTILALNALSDHYRNQINSEQLSMNLNCDISTLKSRFKRNLQFNNENALVMKRLQLDVDQLDQLMDEELSFATRGNGIGFMSVKLKYNVILPEKLCKFDINVELKEWRYVDQKKKNHKRKNTNNILDGDKSGLEAEEEEQDEFELENSDSLNANEFEKMFDKDLLKELDNDFNIVKRTRRSLNKTRLVIRPRTGKQEKVIVDNKEADEKLNKKFEKEFERLKEKDDMIEDAILDRLEDYYESKEDESKFKYEIKERTRAKRSSIFTRFIGRRKSDTSGSKRNQMKQKSTASSSSISDENIRIISDNDNHITTRTIVDDGSFAVYKLKICAQHIPNYDSDMTIIEIGLLTGFEIDRDDLQSKVYDPKVNQSHTFTQLSKVEVTGRTVILYLDSVPHGRLNCYTLKLYQTSQVANLQSGVVKVYDYYRKDDSCTTLYSPALIEHLNITCENKACTCSVNNNCPDNKRIHDVVKISEHNYSQGKNKFQDLVCLDEKLSHVFIGKVVDYKLLSNNLLFKIEQLRKYREKGPQITKTIVLVFNQECTGKLDIKVSEEPYLFFLNGTNYIAKGENDESILTIYPSRRSMIYSLSNQLNTGSHQNVNKYLDEINKNIAKGILECN